MKLYSYRIATTAVAIEGEILNCTFFNGQVMCYIFKLITENNVVF